jgi:hypothetical protein
MMQCKDTSAARDDVMIPVVLRMLLLLMIVVLYAFVSHKCCVGMNPEFSKSIFFLPGRITN